MNKVPTPSQKNSDATHTTHQHLLSHFLLMVTAVLIPPTLADSPCQMWAANRKRVHMEAAAEENPMALTLLDSESEEPNETEGVGQEALQSFCYTILNTTNNLYPEH